MIKQGIANDSIIEKKFKILRTSIMLGNITNREEVMQSYDLIPGSGRSLGEGNGNPLQYSCLENPMDRGA